MVELTAPGTADFRWNDMPLSMELNLWNVERYTGTVVMRFDGERLTFNGDVEDLSAREPERYILGYPEFYYGYKPWERHAAEGTKLPLVVSSVESFTVELSFEIDHMPSLPLNFAMETWLTREKYQVEASIGDVEIMVWFYFNELTPGGKKVESTPFRSNLTENKTWNLGTLARRMELGLSCFPAEESCEKGEGEIQREGFSRCCRRVSFKVHTCEGF